jgi:NitT/TauT family transport system substrate-binding protein
VRHIRVFAQKHLSQAPLLIADAEGYFRDEGLDVELYSAQTSKDAIVPLIQGELAVLTGSLKPSLISAIEQGARIRVVADKGYFAPDGCTYHAFVVRPDHLLAGKLVPRADGKPWRISYRDGSVWEMLHDRAIAQDRLSAEQFETFWLSEESELPALLQGRLDVMSATGAPMQAVVDAGEAVVWKRGQELWPGGQLSVVVFGVPLLDQDPEAGERFMTAYLRGVRQYNEGKTERNLELLSERTGSPRATLRKACWISVRDDGRINLDSVAEIQRWAIEKKILARELPLSEIWEPRFVEAAAKRLAR